MNKPPNIKLAASKTLSIVLDASLWPFKPEIQNRFYIAKKLDTIISGEIDEVEASYWLGWVQSLALRIGAINANELSKLNEKSQ